MLNATLGVDIWDQAGDQVDEHVGAFWNGRFDGCHDGRQLVCAASHDDSVCICCYWVSKSDKLLEKLMEDTSRTWIEVAHECVDPLGTPLPSCGDAAAKISQGDGVLAVGFVLADAAVDVVAECWHDGHCHADGLGGLDILVLTITTIGLLLLLLRLLPPC